MIQPSTYYSLVMNDPAARAWIVIAKGSAKRMRQLQRKESRGGCPAQYRVAITDKRIGEAAFPATLIAPGS